MRKLFLIISYFLVLTSLGAQEVLLPLRYSQPLPAKAETPLLLPFFDDFPHYASPASDTLWQMKGAYVNTGYAPYPPTVGMVTLDAFDAQGHLYPTATGVLFFADTLLSRTIRLDSLFEPFPRALTTADSLYLSFYYLPGGGNGNMWERVGDCPGEEDSLLLEFYDGSADRWELVWGRGGESVDSLLAHSGTDWQYVMIPINDSRFLTAHFRFRFRNYCSLDNNPKPGVLSNADQWNLDYILLDRSRSVADGRSSRDVAFVNPAPPMLRRYSAMPARQYTPAEMADTLRVTISNLFSQELATQYGYEILDTLGNSLYSYDGGYENAPVFWPSRQYQTSQAHARPSLQYAFPQTGERNRYTVVHHIREGVSGDIHRTNDTIVATQVLDNYYAYDDGTPENGYGITSTNSSARLAVRFDMSVEDTLTAVALYFNHTYQEENANIRFRLTVWDDDGGHPGNILYQDEALRAPRFEGLNRYVRYPLEEPLVCSGTLYVGLEQTSSDFINIGYDRNNDASSRLFYLTGQEWMSTVLRGALMLRPYYGERGLLAVSSPSQPADKVFALGERIIIECHGSAPVVVYDCLGREVCRFAPKGTNARLTSPQLPAGLYLVRIGQTTHKIIL